MATIALVASLLLAWWSFRRKRRYADRVRSETIAPKLAGHIFEWSASLAAVLLFYHALLLLLKSGWQT